MQFQYFLAEKLGKFVSEIDRMDVIEYEHWAIHFDRKARREQDAIESSRRSSGRR